MPTVSALPESQTSGDLMTQFIETADKKGVTWTYKEEQNHFYIQNEGEIDLEFKVGDYRMTLRPTENFGKQLDFTSVNVKAITDKDDKTAAYSVYATQYGYPGKDKVEGIETAKPAQNQSTDVEEESAKDKKTSK
ncbi:hypothetical protein [Paenibacillus kandeliae]|uniref:hypothetical protein n=1 Tax=Paenibacillus kandeliae TaxID=3231269 RepID=UPI003459D224